MRYLDTEVTIEGGAPCLAFPHSKRLYYYDF